MSGVGINRIFGADEHVMCSNVLNRVQRHQVRAQVRAYANWQVSLELERLSRLNGLSAADVRDHVQASNNYKAEYKRTESVTGLVMDFLEK